MKYSGCFRKLTSCTVTTVGTFVSSGAVYWTWIRSGLSARSRSAQIPAQPLIGIAGNAAHEETLGNPFLRALRGHVGYEFRVFIQRGESA